MRESNDDQFDLPVHFKGQELYFPASLLQLGYTHKFRVVVNGVEVLLEPDEERNYRAVISPEQEHTTVDIALLAAIVAAVEGLVK